MIEITYFAFKDALLLLASLPNSLPPYSVEIFHMASQLLLYLDVVQSSNRNLFKDFDVALGLTLYF